MKLCKPAVHGPRALRPFPNADASVSRCGTPIRPTTILRYVSSWLQREKITDQGSCSYRSFHQVMSAMRLLHKGFVEAPKREDRKFKARNPYRGKWQILATQPANPDSIKEFTRYFLGPWMVPAWHVRRSRICSSCGRPKGSLINPKTYGIRTWSSVQMFRWSILQRYYTNGGR